jgi:hypothetical protein
VFIGFWKKNHYSKLGQIFTSSTLLTQDYQFNHHHHHNNSKFRNISYFQDELLELTCEISYGHRLKGDTRWSSWLRYYATNGKVVVSIPDALALEFFIDIIFPSTV